MATSVLDTAITRHRDADSRLRDAVYAAEYADAEAAKLRAYCRSLWGRFVNWFTEKVLQGKTHRDRLEDLEDVASGRWNKVEDYKLVVEQAGGRLRSTISGFRNAFYTLCSDAARRALESAEEIDRVNRASDPARVASWTHGSWKNWPADDGHGNRRHTPSLPPVLRVGELEELLPTILDDTASGEARQWLEQRVGHVRVPAYVPFIGAAQTLVLVSNDAGDRGAIGLLQSLVFRVLTLLGRQVKFALLDPSGLGQAFPMQRFLPTCRNPARDVNADLNEVLDDIRRITREVLLTEPGLHCLDAKQRDREPFEAIFVANFPKGFDRRAIETLFSICENGPRAGRYVFIHYARDLPLPRDVTWDQVPNRYFFGPDHLGSAAAMPKPSQQGGPPRARPVAPEWTVFMADTAPPVDMWQPLAEAIKQSSQERLSFDWRDVVGLPDSEWWHESGRMQIATPIGVRGAADKASVWFGANERGTPCSHGVLAGQTGMGKSNLYHTLILGLAVRYSPEEIQFYLVDGKFGTEFLPYQNLPHARVVSLNSPPELARSVLEEMFREMERRNELFRRHQVSDYAGYREKTGVRIPRLLLLIDEYQLLFEDDTAGHASDLLRRLSQQGRSAGIHMLLGKQTFGAPGMLYQRETFANFQLRVSLKLNAEDVQALTEFGPVGKRLLKECDGPGKFVLNATGRDDDSVPGMTPKMDKDMLPNLIRRLAERAEREVPKVPRPVLFRGDLPPTLFENPTLDHMRRNRIWSDDRGMEEYARREEVHPDGGLGQPTWAMRDRPLALWLGRRMSVHGHATTVLRRGPAENLLFLASSADVRAGVLAGVLVSAAALYQPERVQISLVHGGEDPADPTVITTVEFVARLLRPMKYQSTIHRGPACGEEVMDALITELEGRLRATSHDRPAVLALFLDPERLTALRRAGEGLTARAPRSDQFHRLLVDGPQCGIHVAVFTNGLRSFGQAASERQDLPLFTHRVATQMSEDESFTLFRNRKASQLQTDGAQVPTALYLNAHSNQTIKFKPYAALAASTDLTEIQKLGADLFTARNRG